MSFNIVAELNNNTVIVTYLTGEQTSENFKKPMTYHGLSYCFKQGSPRGVITPVIDLWCETLGRSDSPKWSIRRRHESEGRWQIVAGATITFPCGAVWDIDSKTVTFPCGTIGVM
jgi:hypothetical protein